MSFHNDILVILTLWLSHFRNMQASYKVNIDYSFSYVDNIEKKAETLVKFPQFDS